MVHLYFFKLLLELLLDFFDSVYLLLFQKIQSFLQFWLLLLLVFFLLLLLQQLLVYHLAQFLFQFSDFLLLSWILH